VTISVAGAANAGDAFLIEPTRAGATSLAVLVTDTSKIAAAAPIRTAAATANLGDAAISAGTVNSPPPPNANLQQLVTITFTGATTFNVSGVGTGNPTGVTYTSAGNISYNGWTIQITGTPRAGDVFTIGPNTNGSGDNRNALALAQVQTGGLLDGGRSTLQSAYAQLVSDVGNKTRAAQVTADAQAKLLDQTTAARESVSGVNLDEEAANLLRYQQAYQASAKVLAIASTLFDSILEIGK